MTNIPDSSRRKPKLAVFHNLPVGGGISVAMSLIRHLEKSFSITVHYPECSSSPDIQSTIASKEWPFAAGRNISGLRKLFAPVSLPFRLRKFDLLCQDIAREINSTCDLALVHNSMFVAAPPILKYLTIPSVYFCYEYPRHLYEPDRVRRTGNVFFRFLLAPLRSMEKTMDRESISCADDIITFSGWMKGRIFDIYGLDSSIVRPGVDTDLFHPEKGAVKKTSVLSVGALWPFKGHEMALSVVSRIRKDIRPTLVIVADREFPGYGERLIKAATELDVELKLEKRISNAELISLYNSSMAVLCCQHNEPYGLIPLEAMSCGIPVIAVEEGGFTDNIRNGYNGVLVKRDPTEMSGALNAILNDPHLRDKLISGGRKFVTGNRTVSSAGKRLAELLMNRIT